MPAGASAVNARAFPEDCVKMLGPGAIAKRGGAFYEARN
jgi:hypothetical protein